MRNALAAALALVIAVAATVPTAAATRNAKAYATQLKQRSGRTQAENICTGQANEMMYGARMIQRRNFIRDCMMERGFRQP